MMKKWISEQWGNIFINHPTTGSTEKNLVADVHRAQQTVNVKALLKKKNTELKFFQDLKISVCVRVHIKTIP